MLVLLPPSEGKTAPRAGKPLDLASLSLPSLTEARAEMLDALVNLCATHPDAAMRTLDIPKSQPELVALNASLRTAPTARADAIYTGVLYDALSPATLSTAAKRRLGRQVLVTSSLFGLVGMGDRIPAYRLSGDATLPGLGPVAGHWRAHLGAAALEALDNGLLVDLRSSTYAAFWQPDKSLGRRIATVRVLHEVALPGGGTGRKIVSHFNKATKGRLLRALLEDGAAPKTPAKLADALRDLGWTIEVGEPTAKGTQLDVIVSTL